MLIINHMITANLQYQNPICEICKSDYDFKVRQPRIIKCGHTMCKTCIECLLQHSTSKNYIQCPLKCELVRVESVEDTKPNYAIIDLIKQAPQWQSSPHLIDRFCLTHAQDKDYYCLPCEMPICKFCYQEKHSSHNPVVKDIMKKIEIAK